MKLCKSILQISVFAEIIILLLNPNYAIAENQLFFKFSHTPNMIYDTKNTSIKALPGQYATSIHLYNPSETTVKVLQRVSLTYPLKLSAVDDSEWTERVIQPHRTIEICCDEIPILFPQAVKENQPSYVNGLLIIRSAGPVEVTRAYKGGSHTTLFSRSIFP